MPNSWAQSARGEFMRSRIAENAYGDETPPGIMQWVSVRTTRPIQFRMKVLTKISSLGYM